MLFRLIHTQDSAFFTAGFASGISTPCTHMPPNIAATYASTCGMGLATAATTAGPGHMPEMPQPDPNRMPPSTSLGSMLLTVGIWNLSAAYGFGMTLERRMAWKPVRQQEHATGAVTGMTRQAVEFSVTAFVSRCMQVMQCQATRTTVVPAVCVPLRGASIQSAAR